MGVNLVDGGLVRRSGGNVVGVEAVVFLPVVVEGSEVVLVLGAHGGGGGMDEETPKVFLVFVEGGCRVAGMVWVWGKVRHRLFSATNLRRVGRRWSGKDRGKGGFVCLL